MDLVRTMPGRQSRSLIWIAILMLVLWILDFFAVLHERGVGDTYRRAIILQRQLGDLRQASMNNRLDFRNFLLNGDNREAELVTTGIKDLDGIISGIEKAMPENSARDALKQVRSLETEWAESFVWPLIDQRRQIASGRRSRYTRRRAPVSYRCAKGRSNRSPRSRSSRCPRASRIRRRLRYTASRASRFFFQFRRPRSGSEMYVRTPTASPRWLAVLLHQCRRSSPSPIPRQRVVAVSR